MIFLVHAMANAACCAIHMRVCSSKSKLVVDQDSINMFCSCSCSCEWAKAVWQQDRVGWRHVLQDHQPFIKGNGQSQAASGHWRQLLQTRRVRSEYIHCLTFPTWTWKLTFTIWWDSSQRFRKILSHFSFKIWNSFYRLMNTIQTSFQT